MSNGRGVVLGAVSMGAVFGGGALLGAGAQPERGRVVTSPAISPVISPAIGEDPRDRISLEPIRVEDLDLEQPGGVPGLWSPFTPIQNPYSEAKRVLGKILFWDEQLSSDNSMSCGTCHIPSAGGADPRAGVHPGPDGAFGGADDVFGSPGVVTMDETMSFLRSEIFGLEKQVTPRLAQNNLMSMFPGSLFWDGRAEFSFVDPETGEELFQSGVAALEIQSMVPILSDNEMSHQGRTWNQVKTKLASSRPMALGADIPQDMADAIASDPTYPDLFEEAFGDGAISAVRIAFAIATYQRTLIPDQTPWDLWNAGDASAMTSDQVEGWTAFNASSCGFCHAAPSFSNADFMVDGVRPPSEDIGRQGVTGSFGDRGKFKTASIRNIGLRDKLMHTGRFADIDDILDFYGHRNGRVPFMDNAHFLVRNPIVFAPGTEDKVKDFLANALNDPRAANETYPFDRPTLYSERESPNPEPLGGGTPGTGGLTPIMIAPGVPTIGNTDFRVGVGDALPGATAWVAVSHTDPSGGAVASDTLLGPVIIGADGVGTMPYPIADNPALDGETVYMQWIVEDNGALSGEARSNAAKVEFVCTVETSCRVLCAGDFNGDGASGFFDVSAFLSAFGDEHPSADLTGDGALDFFDLSALLTAMADGCP